jgi:hypothetical protein
MHAPDLRARIGVVSWGFGWWQVLGSNQRRLSRRFYRLPLSAHRNDPDLQILYVLGLVGDSGPRLFRDCGLD